MKKRFSAWVLSIFFVFAVILSSISVPVETRAEGGTTLKVHYNRPDGVYDDWDVWLWEYGKDGAGYSFSEVDGEMVATMEVSPGTTSVGYIVRTSSWTKDIDADQFVDISEVVSGTVHIYIESGVEGCKKVLGDDAVVGVKLKTAKYAGNGEILVTMTAEIEGEIADCFTVAGRSGDIAIKEVTNEGNFVYMIKTGEELENSKTYTITYGDSTYKINMPIVYSTPEFEEKYTYSGNDLGYTYTKEKTNFRVWAPTAEKMTLKLYESGTKNKDDLISEIEMIPDVNGTWVCEVKGDISGKYYNYCVTIDEKTISCMDPYARSSGANGARSMVLDLASTNPDGWDEDKNPNANLSINDAIIYETHVRDFTVGSDNGIVNQGKFLGIAETGTKTSGGISTGLDHIKELGVTHLHILPMYDFGSLDETTKANGVYNWGYDPQNYNVPEGTYSTDPFNGEVRVSEMKQMVKGLHDNGISVVMDVVYNHVYSATDFCFNKLVPGYFSRISEEGNYSNGSGCGNDTATERSMVRKYIVDSVNYWADEYHIDGFRFDLVGLIDADTINEIVKTVHEKHPDVIFYGEGWSMTTLVTKDNVVMATQVNSKETPDFAYFNDTIRDGLKGSVFDSKAGFVSGASGCESKVARCFMGADNWCKSPSQTINYVSCHDNNTLYDRLRISRSDASSEEIIRMNNLAAAIYILSEGTPFMQAGEEMLRTKTNDDGTYNHNSYNAGDAVNEIVWSDLENEAYANVYEYYKGLISFRKNHGILRLSDSTDVAEHITEVTGLPSHVVAFDIKGGANGETAEEMFVIFNASEEAQEIELPVGNWNVYIDGEKAGITAMRAVEGTASVNPITTLVLIKEDASMVGKTNVADSNVTVEKSGKNTTGVVAGIVGGIAVLATAVWVIFKRKK